MKRIVCFLIVCLLLSGCAGKRDTPVYRVVTGVQVLYSGNGKNISRTYTREKSMQSILTYLRILKPFGPVIPQESADNTCRITVQYSHGPDSVYVQEGVQYLRQDDGAWERIDSSRASLLYPLLLLLPSDG